MSLWKATDSTASMPKNAGMGQVIKINVAGGTGYTNGAAQAMTLSAPPAGGVQATATATVVGGVITQVNITNQGSGYTTAPTVTAAPAGGADAVFTVKIQPKDTNVVGSAAIPKKIVFLDLVESALAKNRAKGLKIPGWNLYTEYVDAQGTQRYKVENLIAMTKTAGDAGDAEDLVAADVAFAITTQPAATTTTVAGAASVTVVSAGASFQWQVRQPTGGQYVSATGVIGGITYADDTTGTLSITGAVAGNNGTKYRCQVLNAAGTSAATSTTSTLAFGS